VILLYFQRLSVDKKLKMRAGINQTPMEVMD